MKKHLILTALAMLVVSGCTTQTLIDMEAEMAALREAADAYHEAASALDVQAIVALYADDAIMIPPNADQVEGLEGVRNFASTFVEIQGLEMRFETTRVEVSSGGDMGWTLAISEMTFEDPDGQPGSDRVRDFHVWQKQADGSWKVVVDIWNSELPAVGPTH